MKLRFVFVVFFAGAVAFSNEGAGEKIGKKVDKTIEGVSSYSKEQKNKVQKEFTEQLNAIDVEIADIKVKAKKAKATATDETNKQVNDQIAFLEQRRAELRSDFKTLTKSSGKAWDQIKSGFQDSISTLKESFKKAKQEFQSDEQK